MAIFKFANCLFTRPGNGICQQIWRCRVVLPKKKSDPAEPVLKNQVETLKRNAKKGPSCPGWWCNVPISKNDGVSESQWVSDDILYIYDMEVIIQPCLKPPTRY